MQWDDATAARMHTEQQQAEEEAEQEEVEMPGGCSFLELL